MKKLSCLVLSLLLTMAFAGCTKSTPAPSEKASSAEPSASPSPSATAMMDPSMVISHEEIEQMLSRASEATATQEDIDYLLNDAYPILMDTKNLANLLEQVDTSAISPENGEEWKPLIQEISDEAERLCGLFEKTTPSPNFEDFHTLMVTGYRCFSSSMDLIIQSKGEDMDKMMLAVDYMLKGNTYITSANEILTSISIPS